MPFAETQEFSGIGVVLIAPKIGYFDFRLAGEKFPRVTNFFKEADSKLYRKSRNRYEQELKRLKSIMNGAYGSSQVHYFEEMTRQRESVIHFSDVGTLVSGDITKSLNDLYLKYVERNFVTKPYREAQMARMLKDNLKEELGVEFAAKTLCGDVIDIRLPLVHESGNGILAIKPMTFQHPTPIALIDHGVQWVDRIDRFIKEELLYPENTLFALEKPNSRDQKLTSAYSDIRNKIEDTGVHVTDFSNTEKIIGFVKNVATGNVLGT